MDHAEVSAKLAAMLAEKNQKRTAAFDRMGIDIDAVVTAYVGTLLWSESCRGDAPHFDCGGDDCDASLQSLDYDADDMHADAMESIRADVAGFIASNADDIDSLNLSAEDIGHNFMLSRCGHGAGFFDRGWREAGDRLQDAARVYGDTHAWVDGEGYVRVE